MKLFKTLAMNALFLAGSIYGGEFTMQINAEGGYFARNFNNIINGPICYAISNQKRIGMVVESQEKVSAKEIKFVTKSMVIDPYAFGISKEGNPVIHGDIIEDKMIKEVTIKYGEDQFDDRKDRDDRKEGFFAGWFKSDKDKNLNIQKINFVHVVQDSHFDAPKNYQGFKDENVRVVCQLPIAAK